LIGLLPGNGLLIHAQESEGTQGGRRENRQAFDSIKNRAQTGDVEAQYQLALRYANGEGGRSADPKEAYVWCYLANQQGHPPARRLLPNLARQLSRQQVVAAQSRARQVKHAIHRGAGFNQGTNAPSQNSIFDDPTEELVRDEELLLKPQRLTDERTGMDGIRILVPEGWKAEGGIQWQPEQANLASPVFRIMNSDGTAQLQFFPETPFVWGQGGIAFHPEGTLYLGREVMAPVASPAEFIRRVFLPRFRQPAQVKWIGRVPLSPLAQAVQATVQEAGMQKVVRAEAVRIEYEHQGNPVQEDIFCVLSYSQSAVYPALTFWETEFLFSYRAGKEELNEMAGLFHTIAASRQLNLGWFNRVQQVRFQWQRNQTLIPQGEGALTRYLAQTQAGVTPQVLQAYRREQGAYEQLTRQLAQFIPHMELYRSPVNGSPQPLPAGYAGVWLSENGDILFTPDSDKDPNQGAMQNWRRVPPLRSSGNGG
jgi:hypothetical protein